MAKGPCIPDPLPLRDFTYSPPTHDIQILREDPLFLVVNKPAGLLSVAGKTGGLKDCLESRIKHQYGDDIRIVHRLDEATSGVMVLARGAAAHRHIGLQFERRHVQKSYIAHVWGQMAETRGHIDLPLICDWPNRPLQKIDFSSGKPAQTDWEVLETDKTHTRVQLTPLTGRSHQLRVHMLSLGHPILGDRLYAHHEAFRAAPRLLLHAKTLNFHHPDGGEKLNFEAVCPF